MILDFLNEPLPWRYCKDNNANDVRDVKAKCFASPREHMWVSTTKSLPEIHNIFYSLSSLQYADRPDYAYIRTQLESLVTLERAHDAICSGLTTSAQPVWINFDVL